MRYIFYFSFLALFAGTLLYRGHWLEISRQDKITILPTKCEHDDLSQLDDRFYYGQYIEFQPEDSLFELALYKTKYRIGKRRLRTGPCELWAYYKWLNKGDIVYVFVAGRKSYLGAANDSACFARFESDRGEWIKGNLHVIGRHGVLFNWGDPAVTDTANKRMGYLYNNGIWHNESTSQ
jgi:hypothetical protein